MESALDAKLGLEVLEVSPTRVVGRYPVAGNTQPQGLWHGGATCVAAETVASLAAAAAVGPGGRVCGVDINATHLRPVREGRVTATAVALRIGRATATYAVALTDDAGEQVASARVTLALRRANATDS
ncbi:MAG: PaaI family thioesterase [Propionibacteriaceae bacterium]|nr:PaaI family thioesterase [Propionibacteriaceae bacterium]